jgi:hypothetical protein
MLPTILGLLFTPILEKPPFDQKEVFFLDLYLNSIYLYYNEKANIYFIRKEK